VRLLHVRSKLHLLFFVFYLPLVAHSLGTGKHYFKTNGTCNKTVVWLIILSCLVEKPAKNHSSFEEKTIVDTIDKALAFSCSKINKGFVYKTLSKAESYH
jgi:hypothetical protein